MNRFILAAVLSVGIVLAIYGVSVSKSFSSEDQAGSGPGTPSQSENDFKSVPSDGYNETPDYAQPDDIDLRNNNTIETRENFLTQIELVPLDPRGNPVSFSPEVVGLPKRASFNPQTNTLVWHPWYSDAGTYELLFQERGSEYTQKVMIHVEDVPLKSWYQDWIQSDPVQSAMVE